MLTEITFGELDKDVRAAVIEIAVKEGISELEAARCLLVEGVRLVRCRDCAA